MMSELSVVITQVSAVVKVLSPELVLLTVVVLTVSQWYEKIKVRMK